MSSSLFFLIGWFECILICYYVIRPISNRFIRFVLTFVSCAFLSYITCQNLPQFHAATILTVAVCWLMSMRLIAMTLFSRKTSLTFRSFLLKILWIYFPLVPKEKATNQWPIIFSIVLIVVKLLVNHWIYRWSIVCELGVNYARIFMFYLSIMTISYIFDTEMIVVRIFTRDKYTLESVTNFPIFSLSLQEFWGRRYNRIVHMVLKESVFEPVRVEFSSSIVGALATFIMSGLLHVHVCLVAFDDRSSSFPTFIFFFLHGIACCLETTVKIKFPDHIRWIITQTFLLITSPLMLRPFIEKGSPFLMLNPPPLINTEWIPKLSVPDFCP
ncbi:unnamed protein product [Rotaria sp. Silwood2]|nr:unnamed protein product [Rotaria sp. Silwood2]CAF4466139.1 unnamed protein product [Rotaria sp. Silwood2]